MAIPPCFKTTLVEFRVAWKIQQFLNQEIHLQMVMEEIHQPGIYTGMVNDIDFRSELVNFLSWESKGAPAMPPPQEIVP